MLELMPFPKRDEELLKLLDTTFSVKEEQTETNNILLFISTFGLEQGEEKVNVEVLYQLYKYWTITPLGFKKFHKLILNYFTPTPKSKKIVLLNTPTLFLSKEALKLLKNKANTHQKKDFIYFKQHFTSFLKYYDLKEGNELTDLDTLFALYNNWSHYKNRRNWGFLTFKQLCNVILPNIKTKKGTFYKLSSNIYAIVEQEKLMLNVSSGRNEKE